jgi:hypothetical protein
LEFGIWLYKSRLFNCLGLPVTSLNNLKNG